MKISITPAKLVSMLCSGAWLIFALWLMLTPKTSSSTLLSIQNFFKHLDYVIYNIRMRAFLHEQHYVMNKVYIVGIDNRSLKIQPGTWPRIDFAKLIANSRKLGAKAIMLNTTFSSPGINNVTKIKQYLNEHKLGDSKFLNDLTKIEPDFDGDKLLIEQAAYPQTILPFMPDDASNIKKGVLPKPIMTIPAKDLDKISLYSFGGYTASFKKLQSASRQNGGFTHMVRDDDGLVRSVPLVLQHDDKIYPSITLAAAQLLMAPAQVKLNFIDLDNEKVLESIQLGNKIIHTDRFGRALVPYIGKAYTFKYFSAIDVLQNNLAPDVFKDAAVFIAHTSRGTLKYQSTPVTPAYPEIEIQANVLNGIINDNLPYIPYWSKQATLGLVIGLGIFLIISFSVLGPMLSIALAVIINIMLAVANVWLWLHGIVFGFAVPFAMTLLIILTHMSCGFFLENRKKLYVQQAFGQYIPPQQVKLLVDNPKAYNQEGEYKELSVLFSDICGFTSISEKLDASSIKKLLNRYFTPMTKVIFEHEGTIDKYVGDMIMAFWGAPIENLAHQENAILAALAMQEQSKIFNEEQRKNNLPEISIGVGINTGMMNVGDMGSEFRRAYTVLGDSVNLASRLEALTRYYGVNIIVGENTFKGQEKFLFRLLDKVRVKGKSLAVKIYEVIGKKDEISAEQQAEVDSHHLALDAYFSQQWEHAKKLFSELAARYPNKLLYKLMLERIEYFISSPPEKDWDGAYTRHEK